VLTTEGVNPVINQFRLIRRSRSLSVCGLLTTAVAFMAASPALAAQVDVSGLGWTDSSACSAPALTQPFLSARDSNWYTLTPGETPGSFNGAGWTLSGGASIKAGQAGAGSVLDLPSGSQAVSPPMCVAADYPTARTMVRDVAGAQGVHIYVAYAGTKTASQAQDVGQVHGQQSSWTLSNAFNIHPGNLPGWQLMRFTLVPDGKSSDFQVYDFYVDPRMHD
jgi:hypothetical protein